MGSSGLPSAATPAGIYRAWETKKESWQRADVGSDGTMLAFHLDCVFDGMPLESSRRDTLAERLLGADPGAFLVFLPRIMCVNGSGNFTVWSVRPVSESTRTWEATLLVPHTGPAVRACTRFSWHRSCTFSQGRQKSSFPKQCLH